MRNKTIKLIHYNKVYSEDVAKTILSILVHIMYRQHLLGLLLVNLSKGFLYNKKRPNYDICIGISFFFFRISQLFVHNVGYTTRCCTQHVGILKKIAILYPICGCRCLIIVLHNFIAKWQFDVPSQNLIRHLLKNGIHII